MGDTVTWFLGSCYSSVVGLIAFSVSLVVADSPDKIMEENLEKNPLLFEVFSNQVIVSHLGTFLDLESMKTMRCASRLFNEIVLTFKKFRAESVVTLDESRLLDPAFSSLSLRPGHIIIFPFFLKEGEDGRRVTEQVCKLVQDCHSLTIWDRHIQESFGDKVINYITAPARGRPAVFRIKRHCPYVWDVLVAAKSIKTLFFPERAIHFLNPELMKVVEEEAQDLKFPASLKEICLNTFSADVLGAFEQVSGLKRVWSNDSDPRDFSPGGAYLPWDWSSYQNFLGMHRHSLVELILPCYEFWRPLADFIEFDGEEGPELDAERGDLGLLLPNLRSLSMRVASFEWLMDFAVARKTNDWVHARMKNFLNDHIGQLEKLSLVFSGKRHDLVREFPLKHGKRLKSLRITNTYDERSFALLNWLQHIRQLPLLEELELGSDFFGDSIWMVEEEDVDLFAYFPSSLRCFKMKLSDSLRIGRIRENRASLPANPESLQRLSNLVNLELHGEAFGGAIFRGICTHLVSLKSLVLRSCAITDASFLGINEGREVGESPLEDPPLAKLKNLTYLHLDSTHFIAPDVLLFGFKCNRLQQLAIMSCFRIESLQEAMNEKKALIFETLALNNPALDMVKIEDYVWRRFGQRICRFDPPLADDMFIHNYRLSEL